MSVRLVRAMEPVRPVPALAASRGLVWALQSSDEEGDVGHLTEWLQRFAMTLVCWPGIPSDPAAITILLCTERLSRTFEEGLECWSGDTNLLHCGIGNECQKMGWMHDLWPLCTKLHAKYTSLPDELNAPWIAQTCRRDLTSEPH